MGLGLRFKRKLASENTRSLSRRWDSSRESRPWYPLYGRIDTGTEILSFRTVGYRIVRFDNVRLIDARVIYLSLYIRHLMNMMQ